MGDASKLLALAERVEKETGPDRELDADVFMAFGRDQPFRGRFQAWNCPNNHEIEHGMSMDQAIAAGCPTWRAANLFHTPTYTASLDAAMTLVPEGWSFEVRCSGTGDRGQASAWNPMKAPGHEEVRVMGCATPALALTAAALRARAGMGAP